jgi:hypothetical protein
VAAALACVGGVAAGGVTLGAGAAGGGVVAAAVSDGAAAGELGVGDVLGCAAAAPGAGPGAGAGSGFEAHADARSRTIKDATTSPLMLCSVHLASIFCMRSISIV